MPKLCLLDDPLIRVRTGDRTLERLDLPAILAGLGAGAIADFPALRPHQFHAWHAFLVQLAALALTGAGQESTRGDPAWWRARLLDLGGGRPGPWCLVEPDLAQPAFLQPPVPERSLEGFQPPVRYPDDLDMLVTAKNHDVKRSQIYRSEPEHWIFALLTLQTMDGYPGRDNYGIARMNGGQSNRPAVSLAPGLDWPSRFNHDLAALLADRDRLLQAGYGYRAAGGRSLLWLEPWDGLTSLPVSDCDPFFIEICRRVRLEGEGERLVARCKPTKCQRLDAKALNGDTGDAWTPTTQDGDKVKSLTVDASGFSYDRASRLLLEDGYRGGAAQRRIPEVGDEAWFLAWALTRGQGKTEGMHDRMVPLPSRVRARLGTAEGRQGLASLARRRVLTVKDVAKSVLRPALLALMQEGKERLDFKDRRPEPWLRRLDAAVDRIFFDRLWEDADRAPEDADRRWSAELLDLARDCLKDAIRAAPHAAVRRLRAISAAERIFEGAARKHLPAAFAPVEEIPSP